MITGTVDSSQAIARFSRLKQGANERVARAVNVAAINLRTHIVRDELSGQILHRRSGTLSNAVTNTDAVIAGNTISAKVGVFSGVPYARPLEYGATIPPVQGPLMVFSAKDGTTVFTRRRKGFQLKEYAYMRRGLADQRDDILAEISRAVTSEL